MRKECCTKVAVLTTMHSNTPDRFRAAAAAAGLTTRDEWIQAVSPYDLQWLPNILKAMLSASSREPPETLVITDDHFVEPVADALLTMEGPVRRRPHIVANWNFPLIYHGRLPATLVGIDGDAWLRGATELIAGHPGVHGGNGETRTMPLRTQFAAGPAGDSAAAGWKPIDEVLGDARMSLEATAV
jgi:hypothetical protein